MTYPQTYTAYRRTSGPLPLTLKTVSEPLPSQESLGPHSLILKIHAVSLNYRDVAMLVGKYPAPQADGGIPCSDAAAEVVATGSAVTKFKVGDAVSPICFMGKMEGFEDDDGPSVAIGASADGVLRQFAVYEEKHVVKLPKRMGWEEGSTLSCAAVTAWNALDGLKHVPKGASALLQGTGGVSMCALLLCLSAGIQPIITSSSDEKLNAIKKLSPEVRGLNYKTTSDIEAEVKRITNGRGVDFVINNTGPGSIPTDIDCLCLRGGTISLVGFLDGFEASWEPKRLMALMGKNAKIKGVAVGTRADFEEMNRWIEEKNVSFAPTLDRTFQFEEAKEAFDYLASGKHTGKIIITVD